MVNISITQQPVVLYVYDVCLYIRYMYIHTIYTYIHYINIHIYIHTFIHIYVHTYTLVYIYIYSFTMAALGMEDRVMNEVEHTIEDMKMKSLEGQIVLQRLDKYFDLPDLNVIWELVAATR